jgi:hypothetical protein
MFILHCLVVPFVLSINNHIAAKYYIIPHIILICSVFITGIGSIIYFQLPIASAIIVSCEMARMTMKMHSYVREKAMYAIYKDNNYVDYLPEEFK